MRAVSCRPLDAFNPTYGKEYNPYGYDLTTPKAIEVVSDQDDQSYQAFPRGVSDLRNEFGGRNRSGVPYEAPRTQRQSPCEYSELQSPGEDKKNILDIEPETTIGATLVIKGKLSFERLLRLDGTFEGELTSEGDLIVGPRGEIRGDVTAMKELLVYGKVIGNISVDSLDLCGNASIYGNITCKTCRIDPTVVLVGRLNINPYAPQLMHPDGSIAPEPDTLARLSVDKIEAAMIQDINVDNGAEEERPVTRNASHDALDHEGPDTPQAPPEPLTSVYASTPAASPDAASFAAQPVALADGIGEIPYNEPKDGTHDTNDAKEQPNAATPEAVLEENSAADGDSPDGSENTGEAAAAQGDDSESKLQSEEQVVDPSPSEASQPVDNASVNAAPADEAASN